MLYRLRSTLLASVSRFTTVSPGTSVGHDYMATHTGPVELATFASGCFWGTEHIFLKKYGAHAHSKAAKPGVLRTRVGYTGGSDDMINPSYQQVCTGMTHHAEAVRVEFDPNVVQYDELVEYFYRTHDPTTLNRQGLDTGTQYRSAIFYHSPEQKSIAERITEEVQKKHFDPRGEKIVTEISPAGPFYDAEEYHQEYLFKNPSGYQCSSHIEHW